jgi:hypothetical protein
MFNFHRHHESAVDVQAAKGLGLASIGIGLAEIAAPGKVQELLCIEDRPGHRGILRVLGIRELMHGYALLTKEKPSREMTNSVWARVAGDVLDTAVLGVAATKTKAPGRFAAVAAAVMGIGALDLLSAMRLERHA